MLWLDFELTLIQQFNTNYNTTGIPHHTAGHQFYWWLEAITTTIIIIIKQKQILFNYSKTFGLVSDKGE